MNCDLFSELLTFVSYRSILPQLSSFPNYCVWKRLGHSLVLLLGSEKRSNYLHVIVKLKVQKVFSFDF